MIKSRYISPDAWDKNPANRLKNPKLSADQAQKLADEAIKANQKWDAQEQINQRRRQAECGGGLGKLVSPAKFDAEPSDWYALSTGAIGQQQGRNRPRCQAGEGAYGTYFVHPSEQYGIKLFRKGDKDDVTAEFRRLNKADYAGVNVPTPLRMQAIRDADGDIRSQTLIMSHMKGYKTINKEYGNVYGNAADAPLIVRTKIAREFRKLHTAGLAHGDVHGGNVMAHPRSRRVALIDFGYATELHDGRHPVHNRDGVKTLMSDMRSLPEFLGLSARRQGLQAGDDFISRYQGVLDNVEKQAKQLARYGGPDNEERYTIAVKRYHDALERELLGGERMPRSRFVSGADQPRIPGLTRGILTANVNTAQREVAELRLARGDRPSFLNSMAKGLGVKPASLQRALQSERDARLAKQRRRPYDTPFSRSATPKPKPFVRKFNSAGVLRWVTNPAVRQTRAEQRPLARQLFGPPLPKTTPMGAFRIKPGTPTGMRRIKPGVDEFIDIES